MFQFPSAEPPLQRPQVISGCNFVEKKTTTLTERRYRIMVLLREKHFRLMLPP